MKQPIAEGIKKKKIVKFLLSDITYATRDKKEIELLNSMGCVVLVYCSGEHSENYITDTRSDYAAILLIPGKLPPPSKPCGPTRTNTHFTKRDWALRRKSSVGKMRKSDCRMPIPLTCKD